jgi:hypothetical protein
MTKWRMRIAIWISRATNTHLVYVMIIAFPLRQWLHESASALRYTYIACLVFFILGLFDDTFKLLRYLIFLTPERPDRLWGPRSACFLSRGYSGRSVKLTTHLRLVPMCPLHAFMARTSETSPLVALMFSLHRAESPSVHFGLDVAVHWHCCLQLLPPAEGLFYGSCFGHPSDFIVLFSNIAYC